MNLIEINTTNIGSTGKIMLGIAATARKEGMNVHICVAKSRTNARIEVDGRIFIGNRFSRNLHLMLNAITGFNGCFSFFSTLLFLNKVNKLNPDVIHLHNLHNCYINLPLLFAYIKRKNLPVVWTLHDCWPMTGQCAYFTSENCKKWISGCYYCPQINVYPSSYVDNTKRMWKLKKKWFTDVNNLTIVTPSNWLANLTRQSFLNKYPVKLVYNGIDTSIFKPTESDFRKKSGISDNVYVLLGVALDWGRRKGIDVFVELAKRLGNNYQIVLVGTNESIDEKLPSEIISIHRTQNQYELVKLYSMADLFLNPTREDNFPTTNIEALSCGTPVIMFNTGGSPESIDETCGCVVDCDDIDAFEKEIRIICETKPYSAEACVKKARSFDMNDRFKEYVDIIRTVTNEVK